MKIISGLIKSLPVVCVLLFIFLLAKAQQEQDTLYLKRHVDTLYYKSGKETATPKSQQKKLRPSPVELKRNIITLNVSDLFLKNISFGVEFIPGDGKTSITMPLSFYSPLGKAIHDFNNSDLGKYHESLATYIRAGFEVNYYPYGQRKYSYLTGLSLQGAYMKRDVDVQVDENHGVYQGLYFYFLSKNGLNITLNEHFCFSLVIHVGVKTPDLQSYYFALLSGLNLGVKF